MSLEKIQIKIPFVSPSDFDQELLVPVFHQWIREKSVAGMLIDVADYTHVFEGPGIVLIGHDVDYYFDHGKGHTGLLFSRKKLAQGSTQEVIVDALKNASTACALIEKESSLPSPQFNTSNIIVRFPHRLKNENSEQGFQAIKDDLQSALDQTFGAKCQLEKVGEPREMLTVSVTTNGKIVAEI